MVALQLLCVTSPPFQHPCSGGGGAGGWTDSSVPRDLGGHARGGGGGGGDRSSRGSEHSDKESGGGSALAEALALRERDRKRTMEERAAVDHERQARMAANVSAVYDPPAATPVPAHTAPPQGPGHAGVSPPTRPALGSGRSYDADPPPSAPPAADPYPSSSATIHAPPAALPASAPRSDPHLALDPPLQATAHTGSGDPLAPSAYYTSQPGGGGASSSGAQAAKHSGPATTGGGGGDEGEGSLMAVAPLMVPPSATPSYPVPAGLAPLDLSDMRRFLTTPTPRAAGIVQVRGGGGGGGGAEQCVDAVIAERCDRRCCCCCIRSATSCATAPASRTACTPCTRPTSRTATAS